MSIPNLEYADRQRLINTPKASLADDLSSLCSRLGDCVARAQQHGCRIREAGDRIFGQQAVGTLSAQSGDSSKDMVARSLADLIADMDAALHEIGAGLDRL